MDANPSEFTFAVDVGPGEKLSLPATVLEHIGPGRWLVTIAPAGDGVERPGQRDHSAFLRSYAPEDEGLYDDFATR